MSQGALGGAGGHLRIASDQGTLGLASYTATLSQDAFGGVGRSSQDWKGEMGTLEFVKFFIGNARGRVLQGVRTYTSRYTAMCMWIHGHLHMETQPLVYGYTAIQTDRGPIVPEYGAICT